jgi:putative Mg2+ transporter-C (MgtC) family protein
MMNLPVDFLKLLLAVLVGGLIGIEREFRHKVAGFRTNIFICTGAMLFTVFASRYSAPGDAVHIIANIVSGVGFIGAGVILRQEGRIVGLTTAAIIWLTAALGMGIGTGDYQLVAVATVVVSIILWVFPAFEKRIDKFQEARSYEFMCRIKSPKVHQLEAWLGEFNLELRNQKRLKRGDKLICNWDVWGSCSGHEQFVDRLLADEEIEEFRF